MVKRDFGEGYGEESTGTDLDDAFQVSRPSEWALGAFQWRLLAGFAGRGWRVCALLLAGDLVTDFVDDALAEVVFRFLDQHVCAELLNVAEARVLAPERP